MEKLILLMNWEMSNLAPWRITERESIAPLPRAFAGPLSWSRLHSHSENQSPDKGPCQPWSLFPVGTGSSPESPRSHISAFSLQLLLRILSLRSGWEDPYTHLGLKPPLEPSLTRYRLSKKEYKVFPELLFSSTQKSSSLLPLISRH